MTNLIRSWLIWTDLGISQQILGDLNRSGQTFLHLIYWLCWHCWHLTLLTKKYISCDIWKRFEKLFKCTFSRWRGFQGASSRQTWAPQEVSRVWPDLLLLWRLTTLLEKRLGNLISCWGAVSIWQSPIYWCELSFDHCYCNINVHVCPKSTEWTIIFFLFY